jgi:hypothetical protein
MNPINKLISVYKLPTADKLLFMEAVFTSAYVRFALSFLPFKKVAGWLGRANALQKNENLQATDTIKKIKVSVRRCNKYTPWKTECYTQALTGKILLQRHHINSTLFIGFMKDENANYKGHAWLKADEFFVTGYNGRIQQFQVHSFFS